MPRLTPRPLLADTSSEAQLIFAARCALADLIGLHQANYGYSYTDYSDTASLSALQLYDALTEASEDVSEYADEALRIKEELEKSYIIGEGGLISRGPWTDEGDDEDEED